MHLATSVVEQEGHKHAAATALMESACVDHLFILSNPTYFQCSENWIVKEVAPAVDKAEAMVRCRVSPALKDRFHLAVDTPYPRLASQFQACSHAFDPCLRSGGTTCLVQAMGKSIECVIEDQKQNCLWLGCQAWSLSKERLSGGRTRCLMLGQTFQS